MRDGGHVGARLLEFGIGALERRDRAVRLIGEAQLRVAEAQPLLPRRRHAGVEESSQRLAQGSRRGSVEFLEPIDGLIRRGDAYGRLRRGGVHVHRRQLWP
jgi:hypothetical protein